MTRRITASSILVAAVGCALAAVLVWPRHGPARDVKASPELGRGSAATSELRQAPEPAPRAEVWAQRDFAAAYRGVLEQQDSTPRGHALAALLSQALPLAPQATLELALTAPLGELHEATLQSLAVQWGREDRSAVFAWAMTQPATPLRDGIFQRLAEVYAPVDPEGTTHLIAFGMSPGKAQEAAILRVLGRWPEGAESEAAKWLEKLPTEALRQRAETVLRSRLSTGQ